MYRWNVFFFLLPALLLFVSILIAPIFMSAFYSMLDMRSSADFNKPLSELKFIGFQNYTTLFSPKLAGSALDNVDYIGGALVNALLLAFLSVFIQLPIALLVALRLGKGVRGERAYLSIFFMPVLISTVIIGQLWLRIYSDPSAEVPGILNAGLHSLGIDKWLFPWINSHITSSKTVFTGQWLGFKETALAAAFVPLLWQYIGYHMLLMYAGVKGVPTDLLEAGRLDGCTEWQLNRHIVIPYIKPILRVCVIFAVTGSFKSFDLVYELMHHQTENAELPTTLMFRLLYKKFLYGQGSAVAVILIILCFVFALLINLLFRNRGEKVA